MDIDGRLLCTKLTLDKFSFQIINIYAPNDPSRRSYFLSKIPEYSFNDVPTILAGDFNMVENILLDRTDSKNVQSTIGLNEIDQIKVGFDLQDLWRKRFPNRKQFTWSNGQQTHQSRIDRIYIPSNWITKSSNANILPFSWSDHDLVTSTFDLPQNSIRGPGTWKLNTSVLQEQA